MTILEFLIARIAEDEDLARQLTPTLPWRQGAITDGPGYDAELVYMWSDESEVLQWMHQGLHDGAGFLAAWNPARVLAECAAKRAVVADIVENYLDHPGGVESTDGLAGRALAYLAMPYCDHVDYREEWRP